MSPKGPDRPHVSLARHCHVSTTSCPVCTNLGFLEGEKDMTYFGASEHMYIQKGASLLLFFPFPSCDCHRRSHACAAAIGEQVSSNQTQMSLKRLCNVQGMLSSCFCSCRFNRWGQLSQILFPLQKGLAFGGERVFSWRDAPSRLGFPDRPVA